MVFNLKLILVYLYWKNECDNLHDDSIDLPASKFDVDCDECGKGQYLKYSPELDRLECDFCPENTYSLGGGFRINGILKEWNNSNEYFNMISNKSCYVYNGHEGVDCTPWVPSEDKTHLFAGETQIKEEAEYIAKFSIAVNLIKFGKITFKYKKTGTFKNLDSAKLRFYINYISHLDTTLNNYDWKIATYNLSPGMYTFEWEFAKTVTPGVEASKDLYAAIEMIEIEGIEKADLECKKCVNKFSEAGSSECRFCMENHYYDELTNKCIKCHESTYSLENSVGISSCHKRKPCNKHDYQSVLEDKCLFSNSLQLMKYEWIHPFLCHEYSGEKLPKETYVNCQSCEKGEFVLKSINNNITTYTCEECPVETYRNETMPNTDCIKCGDGHYPLNVLRLRNLKMKTIDKYFTNVGWTIQDDVLIPDPRHKGSVHVLEKNILIKEKSGSIIISYKIKENFDPYEYVEITHEGKRNFKKYNLTSPGFWYFEINLDQDLNLFRVEYNRSPLKKFDPTDRKHPIFKIVGFTILNSTEGGGYTCNECEDGYFHPYYKECKKCPYGTQINQLTKMSCELCPRGYFNDGTFSSCQKCPEFTTSNRRTCVLNDVLKSSNNSLRYVIKDLSFKERDNEEQKLLGPIMDKNDSSFYFISHKEKTKFTNSDFSYSQYDNHIEDGHIFGLKKINDLENKKLSVNRTIYENMKLLLNYGSSIEYVKLIKNYTGGIIVKYKDGDFCAEETGKRYSSYLIITCDKKNSLSHLFLLPTVVRKLNISNCEKVFHWKSKYGCRSCLSTELFPILTPCKNSQRERYYTENDYCVIQNPANLTGNFDDFDDNNLIVNLIRDSNDTLDLKIEDSLKKYFEVRNLQIEDNTVFNKTQAEFEDKIFIDYRQKSEKCQFLDDFEEFLIFMIVIPATYLIVTLAIILYCIKYKKIKNNYMQLKDERESNSVITKKNQSQLEMSRTDGSTERKEEVKVA